MNTPNNDSGQPTRDEAIAMMKDGLAQAFKDVTALYVMPLCWVHAEKPDAKFKRPVIADNGSAFLLDCGKGPFLVTANHVFEGYLAARNQRADTVCVIWQTTFPLHDRLIAADAVHDVATFRVTPEEIEAFRLTGKFPLKGITGKWPPPAPQVERGMFFSGFPGDGRTLLPYTGTVEVDWHGYTSLTTAKSVSPTGITLVIEHNPEWDTGTRPTAPPEWALGGCSGAPLLTFIQGTIYGWELGGVIYECDSKLFYGEGDTSPKGNYIVKASRADCINPDGSINRHPDPQAYLKRN